MRRLCQIGVLLSCCCFVAGCGSKSLGPADPSATPQVNESDIKNSMNDMPPEAKAQYGEYFKDGGGAAPSNP